MLARRALRQRRARAARSPRWCRRKAVCSASRCRSATRTPRSSSNATTPASRCVNPAAPPRPRWSRCAGYDHPLAFSAPPTTPALPDNVANPARHHLRHLDRLPHRPGARATASTWSTRPSTRKAIRCAGRILAAEFINNGDRHAVALYRGPSGKTAILQGDGARPSEARHRTSPPASDPRQLATTTALTSAPVGTLVMATRTPPSSRIGSAWLRQPDRASSTAAISPPTTPTSTVAMRPRQGAGGEAEPRQSGRPAARALAPGPRLHHEGAPEGTSPPNPMTVALLMATTSAWPGSRSPSSAAPRILQAGASRCSTGTRRMHAAHRRTADQARRRRGARFCLRQPALRTSERPQARVQVLVAFRIADLRLQAFEPSLGVVDLRATRYW